MAEDRKHMQKNKLVDFFSAGGSILPQSLPHNWPNSSASDIEERPQRIINIGSDQSYAFCSNFVKTSKYEVCSLIRNQLKLDEQFLI